MTMVMPSRANSSITAQYVAHQFGSRAEVEFIRQHHREPHREARAIATVAVAAGWLVRVLPACSSMPTQHATGPGSTGAVLRRYHGHGRPARASRWRFMREQVEPWNTMPTCTMPRICTLCPSAPCGSWLPRGTAGLAGDFAVEAFEAVHEPG